MRLKIAVSAVRLRPRAPFSCAGRTTSLPYRRASAKRARFRPWSSLEAWPDCIMHFRRSTDERHTDARGRDARPGPAREPPVRLRRDGRVPAVIYGQQGSAERDPPGREGADQGARDRSLHELGGDGRRRPHAAQGRGVRPGQRPSGARRLPAHRRAFDRARRRAGALRRRGGVARPEARRDAQHRPPRTRAGRRRRRDPGRDRGFGRGAWTWAIRCTSRRSSCPRA